jgi:Tfp pilus assembly protein PilF
MSRTSYTNLHEFCTKKLPLISAKVAQIAASVLVLIFYSCASPDNSSDPSEPSEETTAADTKTSLSLALSFIDGGRPDKAMYELNHVLSKNPNNFEALNLMGLTQLALSNPKSAANYLEQAWRISPSCATAVNLSSAYIELKRFKDAEKILVSSIKRKEKPEYSHKERLYHNLALVMENTGRSVLAEKMFMKAVEINPMFHLSHMQLVAIYKEKRKEKLQLKHLEAARFSCPTCFEPLELQVNLQLSRGNIRTAKRLIQDYKLTDGISMQDRRRINDLESHLKSTAKLDYEDAPTKSR